MDPIALEIHPLRGTRTWARFPIALCALLAILCVASAWAPPAGRFSWALEVVPGLALVAALAAVYPRFPLTRWVYGCTFAHVCVLVYGGIYTYANTPLGNWARATWHLARNPYDRVGHFALGFFPAFLIREVLLRQTKLERGGWLTFLVVAVALAIGAFWEFLEWWTVLLVNPSAGQAFLGTQGDPWDAHWDMLLAQIGAMVAMFFFSRAHDRALAKLFAAVPARG